MSPRFKCILFLSCCLGSLAGCAQKSADMTSMKQPERPAELDRLEPWIGRWEGTGEMKMIGGQVIKTTGSQEYGWDLDRRVMLARETWGMEGMGPMRGVGFYGYDPIKKAIVSSSFDDWGNVSEGKFKFDPHKNIWHMTYKGHGTMGATTGTGTIVMPDRDTIQWTFEEYFGLIKVMNASGVSKRKM